MRDPFPFDAVLFDLDGTLLQTDLFWLPAAEAGARRAFAELGLDRELPAASDWLGLVGLPLRQGFDALFGDLAPAQRELVMARCVEEEHFALQAGRGALLPGARELLEELRARGVRVGIASNCSRAYLDAAMGKVGLGRWVEEARCLQSPGVETKSDMIQDLLWTFGTRSAVFVGDRATDAEAAHANALPHVHLAGGFAPPDEVVPCEARVPGIGAVLGVLERRGAWLDAELAALGPGVAGGPRLIGVGGLPGAGKTLFARDAARRLAARGQPAAAVELDALSADAPLDDAAVARAAAALGALATAARGVTFVESAFLADPRLRARLDALFWLEAPAPLRHARLAARHLPLAERAALELRIDRLEPFQRAQLVRFPARDVATRVLDTANPLAV